MNDRLDRPERSLCKLVLYAWQPVPISAPVIDSGLNALPALERITEVCRYQFLQLEYALSRGGGVRAWLRVNVLVTMALFIPAMFVIPVLTWLAGSFATLTAYLLQASVNLFYTVIGLIATVAAVLAFGYVLRMLWRAHLENARRNSRGRR
jgi:hypothetical protein